MRQACFPQNFAFAKTVEQVVPSIKRMKSKTKPEEPIKKEVKFACKAEDWESATQSHCKTRSGSPNVVSQPLWFTATRRQAHELEQVFRNSHRQRKSALLRRTAKLSMSVLELVAEQKG